MKKHFILLGLSIAVLSQTAFSQSVAKLKPYGFVRNYFTFDTRESKSGTDELYYYVPLDESLTPDGEDVNFHHTMKLAALTSRLGLDIKGYEFGKAKFGGKFEADFYSGLSGVTGTAQLRLRQAFCTINWDDSASNHSSQLKIGQAWHPMAVDIPHTPALEAGAPFGPFSRSPQVTYDYSFNKSITFSGSAIWQMQYTSAGPEGASANYIKYGCTPEIYLGITFKKDGFLARIGADMLSIKPRYKGTVTTPESSFTTKVNDRITTDSKYVYVQYNKDKFSIKAKSTYARAGEHLNMLGGYGVSERPASGGEWKYTPTRTSSTWLSLSYGKTWQGMLFLGYAKVFGTVAPLAVDFTDAQGNEFAYVSNNYLAKNTYANINSAWRISPCLVRNWGKFTACLELEITSAQYGKFTKDGTENCVYAKNGLATDNLHWVTNHRLQMMLKYSF